MPVMVSVQLLALLLLVAPKGGPESRTEDLTAILKKARQVQVADVKAWHQFRFRRTAFREDRDDEGVVRRHEELAFQVTPHGEDFEERLVEIDGRKPTRDEVKSQRDQARFAKHYRTLLAGNGGDDQEDRGYSLGQLLKMSSYRYAGLEEVNRNLCYRIDFEPDVERDVAGLEGKIARATEGSLWITVDGLHVARARARTVRPVAIVLSLAKLYAMDVAMESAPVGKDTWLPVEIDLKTRARVLFSTRHRRNLYRYMEFEPVPDAAAP